MYLERSTLAVTAYFAAVAASDNKTFVQKRIQAHYEAYYTEAAPGVADALAAALPVQEANATLQTINRARATLAAAVARGSSRPPLPLRDMVTSPCNGYMCNGDGQVIFDVGFNTWADGGTAAFDEVAAGISLTTVGFSAKYLLPNLTYPAILLQNVADALDHALRVNQTVHILMGQAMPDWAEEKWPGLNTGNFTEHGVNYDIDNPGGTIVTGFAINAFLDAHGCHPAFGGWILANEPDFTQSNTNYTLAKYHRWLGEAYNSDIAELNNAWQSSYASFSSITEQPASPVWQTVLVAGGAAAEWWDWNLFNNLRVTQFFKRIVDQIHGWNGGPSTERCMGTTIKLQDGNEFNGHAGKGINRTALVALQTINGNDMFINPVGSGVVSNRGTARGIKPKMRSPTYNTTNYVADWIEMAAGYALQRSANASKPIYNTEWHGASTLGWRDEALTPEYVACAVWTGIYFGEAMNVAWYFPRIGVLPQNANQFADSFSGSFGTEPAATDAFLRTFMQTSAHGEVVAGLGRLPFKIWLLRSWSSFALNTNSTTEMLSGFEIAAFVGVPVGFLYEGGPEWFDAVGADDVVIVAGTSHASDATVEWLRRRAAASTPSATKSTVVVAFDPESDSNILHFGPSGRARPLTDRAFVSQLPTVRLSSFATALADLVAVPAVTAAMAAAPATCVDPSVRPSEGASTARAAAAAAAPVPGVLCKFGVVGGKVRGLVINLNAATTIVSVIGKIAASSANVTAGMAVVATDLLSGTVRKFVGSKSKNFTSRSVRLELAPAEVQLLELEYIDVKKR